MIAGRYTLEREIGRGGTSVVWLARDETLHRPVAMKRIGLMPGADEIDRARAEREARISAQLQDPHVVQVYDVVVAEDGLTHWLVMEYVDGPSLAQKVREQGAMPARAAAPVLLQLAQALLHAHDAGIVHRDVKPSNVLFDETGVAKLTDFGIARADTDPTLTRTGVLTGSPAYLAPEVAAGGKGDQRSDVWALGATAYHLLTGQPPYKVDENVLGTLYRIVHEEPPRLDDAGGLGAFLEGTMTKDPDRRWTMRQVVDYLTGVVAHQEQEGAEATAVMPVPPRPAPLAEESPTRATRLRSGRRPGWLVPALAALAGVAVIALVVALLSGWLNSGNDAPAADDEPSRTPSPSATQTTEAADGPTEEGMRQFVTEYVERVGTDPTTSWPMLTASFQRKSGGFDSYRDFWEGARDGRISNIEADPESMVVSYDVKWKGHSNGPTTRLILLYEDGRYLIDDEVTEGFEPQG